MGLHGQGQQAFEDAVDCSIHRPLRKANLLPIAEAQSLKAPSNGKGQEGTEPIVDVPDHRSMTERGLAPTVVDVAFVTKVRDDFVRIERKANGAVVDDDIAGLGGRPSGMTKVHEVLGTAVVIDNCSVHGVGRLLLA